MVVPGRVASNVVFRLGSQLISYSTASDAVLQDIARIFPRAETSIDNSKLKLIEGEFTDVESAMLALSKRLLADFDGDLWLEAAALVAPGGASVMLCGGSETGKSTLTAALCEYGWKMISEDVVFIQHDGIIPQIVRPISLREGTAERIAQQTGKSVQLFDDRWYLNLNAVPDPDFKLQLPLSAVVAIGSVDPDYPGAICIQPTPPEQLVREFLPYSNALHIDGGVEFFLQSLQRSICVSISGGSIAERIDAIDRLIHR